VQYEYALVLHHHVAAGEEDTDAFLARVLSTIQPDAIDDTVLQNAWVSEVVTILRHRGVAALKEALQEQDIDAMVELVLHLCQQCWVDLQSWLLVVGTVVYPQLTESELIQLWLFDRPEIPCRRNPPWEALVVAAESYLSRPTTLTRATFMWGFLFGYGRACGRGGAWPRSPRGERAFRLGVEAGFAYYQWEEDNVADCSCSNDSGYDHRGCLLYA